MIKRTALIFIFFLLIFFPLKSYASWELAFQPRQRVVKTIGVVNDLIFIGTGNGVFVSKDEGSTWEDFGSNQLLKDNTGNSIINWITIDEDKKRIYIATSFGAYYSEVDNPNWQKVFIPAKSESKAIDLTSEDIDLSSEEPPEDDDSSQGGYVNSITIDNAQIYLSTNDGVWICDQTSENKCQRLNEGLEPDNESGNQEVFYTLKADNDLFLSASNGIYLFDNKNLRWTKLSTNIQKLESGRIDARYLYLDKEKKLWAVCGTGIYTSGNRGKTWEKRSDGIKKNNDGFQEMYYLFENEDRFYAACASGVYYLKNDENTWQELTDGKGIRTKEGNKNVYWLAKVNGDFYAATDEGLFVNKKTNDQKTTISKGLILKGKIENDFANLEDLEPSVVEVQKQALKFASLPTTNDYKRYRVQARLRNLIPRVGFDINSTGTNTNYYQFQNGISTGTSSSNDYNADNTKRLQHDGRLYKQLSVSWDANQILYDDGIWRVLNQARLTANIKENLLDDVTRIYYQRRKLQLENLLSPEGNISKKLGKELEISELTGQLDSRTGGWFSREIEKRKYQLVRKNG